MRTVRVVVLDVVVLEACDPVRGAVRGVRRIYSRGQGRLCWGVAKG